MRRAPRVLFGALFAAALAAPAAPGAAAAGSASAGSETVAYGRPDPDPLRRELPSPDLYMQVPGGALAVSVELPPDAPVEQVRALRDGGFVVGYCLKSSCSYVTHIAVLQVCGNRVGGPQGTGSEATGSEAGRAGADNLVLGIVKLPYGRSGGYVKSLQGRDYAANFAAEGPLVQPLMAAERDPRSALFALQAVGKGPVAALDHLGLRRAPRQSPETAAVRLVRVRDGRSGLQNVRFEVRHLCQKHLS